MGLDCYRIENLSEVIGSFARASVSSHISQKKARHGGPALVITKITDSHRQQLKPNQAEPGGALRLHLLL
jgi:hypothetical protein